MKDFVDLVLKRQSCRNYDGKPIDDEVLNKCFDTARLAPSACNSQPWHFIVARGEKMKELAKAAQIIGANKFADKASALIAISIDKEPKVMPALEARWGRSRFSHVDVGIVAAYLTLQAAELGLGTCILGAFEEDDANKILDVPADQSVCVIIAIGHPVDDNIRAKSRKTLDETVKFA